MIDSRLAFVFFPNSFFLQPEKFVGRALPRRAAAKYKLRERFDDWGEKPVVEEQAAITEGTEGGDAGAVGEGVQPTIEGEATVEGR